MKRITLLALLILCAVTLISAHDRGRRQNNPFHSERQRPAAETVTVSGSLVVAHGMPALKSGDETYLLGGIRRLAGFVDGLKEGAQVTISGKAFTAPSDKTVKFLRPAKLTLNGKEYDMSTPKMGFRQFNAPNQRDFQDRNRQHRNPDRPQVPGGQRWL